MKRNIDQKIKTTYVREACQASSKSQDYKNASAIECDSHLLLVKRVHRLHGCVQSRHGLEKGLVLLAQRVTQKVGGDLHRRFRHG